MKKTAKTLSLLSLAFPLLLASCSQGGAESSGSAEYRINEELAYYVGSNNLAIDGLFSQSEGSSVYLYLEKDMPSKVKTEDITLSEGFANLSVLSLDASEEYVLAVTLQGQFVQGSTYGIITISGSALGVSYNPYAEIEIYQEEFTVAQGVDKEASVHEVIISSDAFVSEYECASSEITLSEAFSGLTITSLAYGDGSLTLSLSGSLSADYSSGLITLSPKAANYYNGASIPVDIYEPRLVVKDQEVGFHTDNILYFEAENFSFASDIAITDLSLTFTADGNSEEEIAEKVAVLEEAFVIKKVELVFDILAVTIDVDETSYDIQLNAYNNVFLLNIDERGTSLTRDISCHLTFPTVYYDYEYIYGELENNIVEFDFTVGLYGGSFLETFSSSAILIQETLETGDVTTYDSSVIKSFTCEKTSLSFVLQIPVTDDYCLLEITLLNAVTVDGHEGETLSLPLDAYYMKFVEGETASLA